MMHTKCMDALRRCTAGDGWFAPRPPRAAPLPCRAASQGPWTLVEPHRQNKALVAQPPPIRPPKADLAQAPGSSASQDTPPATHSQPAHSTPAQSSQPVFTSSDTQHHPRQAPETASDTGFQEESRHAGSGSRPDSSRQESRSSQTANGYSNNNNSSSSNHTSPPSNSSHNSNHNKHAQSNNSNDGWRWGGSGPAGGQRPTGRTQGGQSATLSRPPSYNYIAVAHMANQVRETTSWLQLAAILDSLQAPQPLPLASLPTPYPANAGHLSSSHLSQQQQQQQQQGGPSTAAAPSPPSSSPLLNMALLSAMLGRLAKMRRYPSTDKYPDSEMLRFVERVATAACPLLATAEPKHIANTLWALAKLNHHPGFVWMETVLAATAALLSRYDDISLSQTLWALATLNHQPGPFFLQRFYEAAYSRLQYMSPQSMSNIMWAAAVLKAPPPAEFLERFLATTLIGFPAHKVQGLSNSVWAFAMLEVDPGKEWLQRLLQESEIKVDLLLPQDIANIMWALAKLNHAPSPEWTHKVIQHSYSMLPSFQPEELSNLLWACVTLKLKPPTPWLLYLMESSAAKLSTFKSQEISILMWSFASLGTPVDRRFSDCMFFFTAPSLCYFNAQDCANMLWALATLGIRPPELWLEAFVEESFTQLPYAAPQHFSNLVAGFSKLGRLPPETWQDRFFLETRPQLLAFKAPELAQMMYAFGVSRITPPQQWMSQLMMATHAKAEFLTAHGLANLMFGISRVGFRPNPKWLAQMAAVSVELAPGMTPLDSSSVQKAFDRLEYPLPDLASLRSGGMDDDDATDDAGASSSSRSSSINRIGRGTTSVLMSSGSRVQPSGPINAFLAPSHVRTILHAKAKRGAGASRSRRPADYPTSPPQPFPALTGAPSAVRRSAVTNMGTSGLATDRGSQPRAKLPALLNQDQSLSQSSTGVQYGGSSALDELLASSASDPLEASGAQPTARSKPPLTATTTGKGKRVTASVFPLLTARTATEHQQADVRTSTPHSPTDLLTRQSPIKPLSKAAKQQAGKDTAQDSATQQATSSSSSSSETQGSVFKNRPSIVPLEDCLPAVSEPPAAAPLAGDIQSTSARNSGASHQAGDSTSIGFEDGVLHTASSAGEEIHPHRAPTTTLAQAPFYFNEELKNGSKRRNAFRKKLAAITDSEEE